MSLKFQVHLLIKLCRLKAAKLMSDKKRLLIPASELTRLMCFLTQGKLRSLNYDEAQTAIIMQHANNNALLLHFCYVNLCSLLTLVMLSHNRAAQPVVSKSYKRLAHKSYRAAAPPNILHPIMNFNFKKVNFYLLEDFSLKLSNRNSLNKSKFLERNSLNSHFLSKYDRHKILSH